MEKIKDALAKAKQQISSDRNNSTEARGFSAQKPKTHTNADNLVSNTENVLGNINYTHSATIALNEAHLEKNRVLSHLKNDVNSSIFDSLRTQILQKMEENNWRTLLIISPTPASGKSLVSINLAISIAQQPQKTAILVDLDLRRPTIANYLGIHVEKSINDYLLGNARVEDIIYNPGIPRLVVAPTMRPIKKSAEILSSNKVSNLINELRERYDSRIVIFDAPPILNSDDAMVLLPQVDCFLLVIASGMSTQSDIEEAMFHLPKEKLLGVVLNKAELEAKPYYY
jgi:protein-tyrosine kinase